MSNTFAVGDLVKVISDYPTYRLAHGAVLPSSTEKGALLKVISVWPDGDLDVQDVETGHAGIVVSPQHVEAYVAPVITAPFADYGDLADWQETLARVALSYCIPQRAVTGIAPSNGWDTVQEGLDRAAAIIDEGLDEAEPEVVDAGMLRRTQALLLAGQVITAFGQTTHEAGGSFNADLDDAMDLAAFILDEEA